MNKTLPHAVLALALSLPVFADGTTMTPLGIIFPDGTTQTTAAGSGAMPSGTAIVTSINDPATSGTINFNRLPPTIIQLTPGVAQTSVGDTTGSAPMINLRGTTACCGVGGQTPNSFKVFQNGSMLITGKLGVGGSPVQGEGYRTSWDGFKAAFRSGHAYTEWDDGNVGYMSWAGGESTIASGVYAFAFGEGSDAEGNLSISFGSYNQVKGSSGFSVGAQNRVCASYGVAMGYKAQSGGPLVSGRCDPESANRVGTGAVALGYNVTADNHYAMALGKFASNNGHTGSLIWSDGTAQTSGATFLNTANNEAAFRASGGFRFRTNSSASTGCNLPAGSGTFSCTSSRTTKENFVTIDGESVLHSLRAVPVSSWNYIAEGPRARHIGPMAEDFHAAFSLGSDDRTIGIQDLAGVALAAVQALEQRTAELQKKAAEVDHLRARLHSLEERLARLENKQ